jgi:3-dehydroquinate synthase (EC 4.2.3.4)
MNLRVGLTPSYDVHIQAGMLDVSGQVIGGGRIALITDTAVAPLYAERVRSSLEASGADVTLYCVKPGEESKSLGTLGSLLSQMAQQGFHRKSKVVALGGGVVSDLAGFVAASYMRGIPFYIASTTLLGMVDAAVGGKTGVNLAEGKNLVGAFWQPKAVLMDVSTLATLPEREFRGGAVELFKHGLIADKQLLEDVTAEAFAPQGDAAFLEEVVHRSVKVKADIVAADEREEAQRAHLNLGHTLAHALEAFSHHQLAHGDAVIYGLLFAAELSAARGYDDETPRILDFLRWVAPAPLPVSELAPPAPLHRPR